jgi:hypothetical protein
MKVILFVSIVFFTSISVNAEIFNILNGDTSGLSNAIISANANNEADTIILATNGTYIFNNANHETFTNNGTISQGWTALPQIESSDWPVEETLDLVILGNGASFIRNSNDDFRFIYIHVTANVIIKDLSLQNGRGKHRGGAIFSGWRSSLQLENCTFDNNCTFENQLSFDQGGGAVMIASESRLAIENCSFSNNRAEGFDVSLSGNGGGAVLCLLSNLQIENCFFENNVSDNFAGAVYTDGALKDEGDILINNCVFVDNHAQGGAGALLNYIYNLNTSTIENCHFQNNLASNGHGGALYSGASSINHSGYTDTGNHTEVTIRNNSFIDNTSSNKTGAVFINEHHSLIENCTFSGNSGGDLANALFVGQNRLSCQLSNLTVAHNGQDNTNKALFIADTNAPPVQIKNCIFSENNAGHLGWQAELCIELIGNNLQFPGNEFGDGDMLINADPLLLLANDNGGPTQTMALQEGSPAIDVGSDCPQTDQRGATRVGACDIGAYEYGGSLNIAEMIKKTPLLEIYPNPSNGNFFIELHDKQPAKIQIFSVDGMLIYSKTSENDSIIPFELTQKGLFLVKVISNNQVKSNMIILQ